MSQKALIDYMGDVARITLNDPDTLNAAGVDMVRALSEAFNEASARARAIVLTGAGRGFCSGANLSSGGMGGMGAGEFDAGAALERVYNPFILQLRDLPIPFVTAVNGACAGIGVSIALMGDLCVAGESAYFLQAFRRIGLIPDGGSTWLLPRLIGRARAMELMLMGEKLPAPTALEWGLINRVTPDDALQPTAMELAQKLSEGPKSLALIRKAAWSAMDAGLEEQLAVERALQRDAGRTKDFLEGVIAFREKRPAKFEGR